MINGVDDERNFDTHDDSAGVRYLSLTASELATAHSPLRLKNAFCL
jgi:hypothetical protein